MYCYNSAEGKNIRIELMLLEICSKCEILLKCCPTCEKVLKGVQNAKMCSKLKKVLKKCSAQSGEELIWDSFSLTLK